MNYFVVLSSAFINGFVALALEVLAPRMIAPYFGQSPAIWAIVISTFLLGLSLGYWLGANKNFNLYRLYLFNIFFLIALLFYREIFAILDVTYSYPTLQIMLANLIFLPNAIIFGLISPQLARAIGESAQKSYGYLAAAATVGGILGCLVTSLFLFEWLNTLQILFSLISLILLLFIPVNKKWLIAVPALIALIFLSRDDSYKSKYQDIHITTENNLVFLWAGGNIQSAMNLKNENEPAIEYISTMLSGLNYSNKTEHVLFLGLGGGSMAKSLHYKYPNINITAVEFDPTMIELARNTFRLPKAITIYNQDARMFLKNDLNKYDAIFLDCYSTITPPAHLVTLEFYQLLKEHLTPGGIVVSNLLRFSYIESQIATQYQVFSNIKTIKTNSFNLISLASTLPIEFKSESFPAPAFAAEDYKSTAPANIFTDIKSIGQYIHLRSSKEFL
ncbi:MAG: fused MFS/spermidine synthase [Bdellovibrionales bacterium]|nr:fused MFS/spermidine synthase [Bdellovibrionales bacterium]